MKKIAVISDLSGLGKCSLSAALPVISATGAQCCPITTAVLTNQTDYNSYFCNDLTETIDNYVEQWDNNGFTPDSVLTGYMASEKQIDKVISIIKHYKHKGAQIIVDPVMADNGKVYKDYSKQMCSKMKELCKYANVITPNLSELCILCEKDFSSINVFDHKKTIESAEKMAKTLLNKTLKTVIVTGIFTEKFVYTVAINENNTYIVKNKRYKNSFSGTGDIFSALFTALYTKGFPLKFCISKTVKFIAKSANKTKSVKTYSPDGTDFELCLKMLTKNKIINK